MIGLIDGDLVAFRCSASVGDQGEEEIAVLRTDRLMQELLHSTQVDRYSCFISGGGNFRKKINPEYKANRKEANPLINKLYDYFKIAQQDKNLALINFNLPLP